MGVNERTVLKILKGTTRLKISTVKRIISLEQIYASELEEYERVLKFCKKGKYPFKRKVVKKVVNRDKAGKFVGPGSAFVASVPEDSPRIAEPDDFERHLKERFGLAISE